jgi:hypothetical protein
MAVHTSPQRFLTINEAAAELGVSEDWARQHLPVVRLGEGDRRGAVVRVPRQDLDRFVEERRRPG